MLLATARQTGLLNRGRQAGWGIWRIPSGSGRGRAAANQRMWIGIRRVVERPGVRAGADVELALRVPGSPRNRRVVGVPTSLVNGPISHSCAACRRAIGKCPVAYSARAIEGTCSVGLR